MPHRCLFCGVMVLRLEDHGPFCSFAWAVILGRLLDASVAARLWLPS